ncbi:MAG TPA: C39 family peptidase [Candidatus Binatia bacterium]|nr:C39 family peptidase [Candidatus Binatia bacterium]
MSRRQTVWLVLVLAAIIPGAWLGWKAGHRVSVIPSRGGESFATPPIGTVHYRQKDARWNNDLVGELGEPMAKVGCTVCSLAMMFDFYGVRLTPKELNQWLNRNGGYTAEGWLIWDSVRKVSNEQLTIDYIGGADFEVIDRALKNNQPVIAKVFINGVIPHWVLIVGKQGTEYLMRDPLGEQDALDPLSRYGSRIYAIRILKKTRAMAAFP